MAVDEPWNYQSSVKVEGEYVRLVIAWSEHLFDSSSGHKQAGELSGPIRKKQSSVRQLPEHGPFHLLSVQGDAILQAGRRIVAKKKEDKKLLDRLPLNNFLAVQV